MDGSGRVLIAPELRNASGMTRDVMLLGLGAHFELWDAATLASREAEDLAKGMPDVLNQFSFWKQLWNSNIGPSCWSRRWTRFACRFRRQGRVSVASAVRAGCRLAGGARRLRGRHVRPRRSQPRTAEPPGPAGAAGGVRQGSPGDRRGHRAGRGGFRVEVVHGGFATMAEELRQRGIDKVDGVMLDLGVSSPQIDDAERGFSFMRDGPLDMRMDTTRGPTVADWLAQASVDEMREVIADYGEERFAFQVAKAIAARRATRPLRTTLELAECVASAVRTRERGSIRPRTFQALRIYINRELEELARTLASALDLLARGGWR